MLLQFEFLTERARERLVERQNAMPEALRVLLASLPEILDRLERAVNPPRSARPIDRPRFVGPIVVDGRFTEPEAVTETVSSLIDAAIELSRAGWTRDPVGFWVSPDPTDGDALDTAGAIRKLRKDDPIRLNRAGWYGCAVHGRFEDCFPRCAGRIHIPPEGHSHRAEYERKLDDFGVGIHGMPER